MHTISTVGYFADNWLAVSLRVWIISFLTVSGAYEEDSFSTYKLY